MCRLCDETYLNFDLIKFDRHGVSIGGKTRLLHHFQWSVSLSKRNGMSSNMQVASSVGFPYRDKRIWGAHMDLKITGHPLCVCETIIEFDTYFYIWISWSCVLFFLVTIRFSRTVGRPSMFFKFLDHRWSPFGQRLRRIGLSWVVSRYHNRQFFSFKSRYFTVRLCQIRKNTSSDEFKKS